MLFSLMLSMVAASGPLGPAAPVFPAGSSQGMSERHHGPARDEEARRVCLVERSTGRTICRRMDAWRVVARRLEREQAQPDE